MFTQAISSPNAPKALGPYSQAIKLGDFVYLSGQIPMDPSTGAIVEGGIQEQTQQVLKNIEAVLSEMNLETRHVVKTTVFMTDLSEFDDMNKIYGAYFNEPFPARSTIQVVALPKGAKIEIECTVIDTLAYERQMNQGCGGGCSGGCSDGDCGCDCEEGHDCGCEECGK
ncbi:RidA family protein [Anaerorhabdus sp.]|uniref:Putative aminoacrylate peracid reductase RutC n=1 Tax=bioreactor metagenome TaxID=1076179 RepID=A0A645H978_9ZZZZ|nr:RidA family protein [Anaerorhabdus sp.]MEA4875038.1 RidA family protein [Anaerorhabdus sp.]